MIPVAYSYVIWVDFGEDQCGDIFDVHVHRLLLIGRQDRILARPRQSRTSEGTCLPPDYPYFPPPRLSLALDECAGDPISLDTKHRAWRHSAGRALDRRMRRWRYRTCSGAGSEPSTSGKRLDHPSNGNRRTDSHDKRGELLHRSGRRRFDLHGGEFECRNRFSFGVRKRGDSNRRRAGNGDRYGYGPRPGRPVGTGDVYRHGAQSSPGRSGCCPGTIHLRRGHDLPWMCRRTLTTRTEMR